MFSIEFENIKVIKYTCSGIYHNFNNPFFKRVSQYYFSIGIFRLKRTYHTEKFPDTDNELFIKGCLVNPDNHRQKRVNYIKHTFSLRD